MASFTGGYTSFGQPSTSAESVTAQRSELDKVLQRVEPRKVQTDLRAAAETLLMYSHSDDKNIKEFYSVLTNLITGKTSRSVVKVCTVCLGEISGAAEALMEQVNTCQLQVKRTDWKEELDVYVVFCPVTPYVEITVGVAMEWVTGDNPVILVLMYHSWEVDLLPSGKNWSETFPHVVLDVHVLIETAQGFPMCPKNKGALRKIQEVLLQHSTPE
ncbi:uncharacterized protein LOC108874709 [Lates calcarifer]|uniref:Uncharacterized protein LOC108874709 n=1 Tax=Lates calcarifer TaxID=8187 RepID=A0AAJ7PD76_LATCA|nr:uncharacterized protein LOC108874709 [Lates calcarifer]